MGIEFKFKLIDLYFPSILTFAGKGFWYLFLATTAFGDEWWSMFIAILLICNGMLNSYVGCSPNPINKKNIDSLNEIGKNEEGKITDEHNNASNNDDHELHQCDDIVVDDVDEDDDELNVNIELGQMDNDEKTPLNANKHKRHNKDHEPITVDSEEKFE